MHTLSATLVSAAALALAAAAPAAAHEGHSKKVDVTFAAVAGDQPVACGSPVAGLGMNAQSAQIKDLRFYVTDVKLIRSDGKGVAVKLSPSSSQLVRKAGSVTLIDLENGTGACAEEGTKATNAHVRGTVPEGKYKGLSYSVGVPSALNHTDLAAAPSPLNLAAMGWSWQVGRKFLKIETADPSFMVHLGSTGCTGNPASGAKVRCTSSNRAAVKLKSFDPSKQKVAVDVKQLLSGTMLTAASTPMGGMTATAAQMDMDMSSACMSGPGEKTCGSIFDELGIGWSDTAGGGAASSAKQKVFRGIKR
ncbi:MbnP family copper-binding protein [Baekduia sp. Peel2402]|uniref:MbnP family copper-binding protein n=1 Tax=Baekduia sp. Peel2402 TaxID=3458296 RepID=UPI00403EE2DF